MKFREIVAESKLDAHEIYGLEIAGKVHWAPSPVVEAEGETAEDLQRLRNAERVERAEKMAKLVDTVGLDRCEAEDVTIAKLLPPPVHIQEADNDLMIDLSNIAL